MATAEQETLPIQTPDAHTTEHAEHVCGVRRARFFSLGGLCLSAFGFLTVALVDAHPAGQAAMLVAMTVLVVLYAWLFFVTRTPAGFQTRHLLWTGVVGGLASVGAAYYIGVSSYCAAFIGIILYSYCSRVCLRHALITWLVITVCHGTLAVLLVTGVIPDAGIVKIADLPLHQHVVGISGLLSVYLLAFLAGRSARNTQNAMTTELQAVQRVAAARELQIHELRNELGVATGVGEPGPLSGAKLGSFRLGVLLGRGGMGEIYEASHLYDETLAAVKILHRHAMANPMAMKRFKREAEIARRVPDAFSARILEVGADGALPYIAMERLHGRDLAVMMREQSSLSPDQARSLLREVAAGIDAAHAAGVVHRDLKPSNLFCADAPDGTTSWRILDFGISKTTTSSVTITRNGLIGTPAYMAPEQVLGHRAGGRADVHALALVAYRVLTGRTAFTGRSAAAVCHAVVSRMPPRPSAIAALPPEVDDVLAIGLAKLPQLRFETAGELARALLDALDGRCSPELARRADRALARHPWPDREGAPALPPRRRRESGPRPALGATQPVVATAS